MSPLDNNQATFEATSLGENAPCMSFDLMNRNAELLKVREALMAQLGCVLYGVTKDNQQFRAPNEALYSQIEQVDMQRGSIAEQLQQLENLAAEVAAAAAADDAACLGCGAALSSMDLFCRRCGKKTPLGEQARVCPACGAVCENDAIFCITCGAKLDASEEEIDQESLEDEAKSVEKDETETLNQDEKEPDSTPADRQEESDSAAADRESDEDSADAEEDDSESEEEFDTMKTQLIGFMPENPTDETESDEKEVTLVDAPSNAVGDAEEAPAAENGLPASLVCGACGAQLDPDDVFCSVCGTPVAAQAKNETQDNLCGSCGYENSPGSNFCLNCGAKLK